MLKKNVDVLLANSQLPTGCLGNSTHACEVLNDFHDDEATGDGNARAGNAGDTSR